MDLKKISLVVVALGIGFLSLNGLVFNTPESVVGIVQGILGFAIFIGGKDALDLLNKIKKETESLQKRTELPNAKSNKSVILMTDDRDNEILK